MIGHRRPVSVFIATGLLVLAGFAGRNSAQSKPTASAILDAIDQNMVPKTIMYTARMIIYHPNRTDVKEMKTWAEGMDKGFVIFTAPARDKDTKYLKLGDNLWMYLPSVEKVIKISGHLLRQSMMGSDFSYEDSLERQKLREYYGAVVLDDDEIDGRPCYVLELTAIRKDATYFRRKIWVDKERNIALRSERYAKTGKLLKVMSVQKIERFSSRYYPTHISMEDKLRKDSKTEFIMEDIQFDVQIPPSTFTRRNLEKK